VDWNGFDVGDRIKIFEQLLKDQDKIQIVKYLPFDCVGAAKFAFDLELTQDLKLMVRNVVNKDGGYLNNEIYFGILDKFMLDSCNKLDWDLLEAIQRILVLYKYSDF
jgi:hypothetical protein